jgi:exonuclease SbcC
MIKRITVENFMAHKSTALELAAGVTVITGPNNSGKSALVEAIRSIAHNPPFARSAIRHGEKKAVVRLELDSGETIEWERNDKTSIYKVSLPDCASPEVYAKFGKTPPEDVRALLRIDNVETETGPVDIHIGNQRYPIFLLDQSGSQAASFFAASTEAEYLLKMQQSLKQRTDGAKAKRKAILRDCAELEKNLGRFEPLESLAPLLRRVELLHEKILAARETLPDLERFLEELRIALEKRSGKAEGVKILGLLTAPPNPLEVSSLDRLAGEIAVRTGVFDRLRLERNYLAGLSLPPIPGEVEELSKLASGLANAVGNLGAAFSRLNALAGSEAPPPDPAEVEALRRLGAQIEGAARRVEALRARSETLATLSGPPPVRDPAALAGLEEGCSRTAALHELQGLRLKALDRLAAPPAPHDPRELEQVLMALENTVEELEKSSSETRALSEIALPPTPEEAAPLRELIGRLDARGFEAAVSSRKGGMLARLDPPPRLWDVPALEELTGALSTTFDRKDRLHDREKIFEAVSPPPDASAVGGLDSTIARISLLEARIETLKRSRGELEEAMSTLRSEVERAVAEAGTCPLCGRALDVAHFLEEEHG